MVKASLVVVALILAACSEEAPESQVDARELGLRVRVAWCERRASCSKTTIDIPACTGVIEDAPVLSFEQYSVCERLVSQTKCGDALMWMDPPPAPCPEVVFADGGRYP